MEKVTGVIKFYNSEKGYAFAQMENGESVFVHISDVDYNSLPDDDSDPLAKGYQVEFEIGEGRDGRKKAVNVVIVSRD